MFLQGNHNCYVGHQSKFSKKILPIFYVKVNFFVLLDLLRDDQMISRYSDSQKKVSFIQAHFYYQNLPFSHKLGAKPSQFHFVSYKLILKMPFVTLALLHCNGCSQECG